jgi:hypothetical protein
MKYDVSVITPGIRPDNWERMYHSIEESTTRSWELITCGPKAPPQSLFEKRNFKFVNDWGSPTRCACIAMSLAEGEFMTWGSDDGYFLPGGIDHAFQYVDDRPTHVVCCKYYEGTNPRDNDVHRSNEYYSPGWLQALCVNQGMSTQGKYLFNLVIMPLRLYESLGGCDTDYETWCISEGDLAMRAYLTGVTATLAPDPIYQCSWDPNPHGEHGPVHRAHTQRDDPLLKARFAQGESPDVIIPLDKWKSSPSIWTERFAS